MTVLLLLALTAACSLPGWLPRLAAHGPVWWLSPAAAATGLAAAAALAAAVPATGGAVSGLILSSAMLVAVLGGGPATVAVLRLASRPGGDVPPRAPDAPTPSEPGVLRGGAWIGALERAGVAATLLAGWPEGLAVVLAVKGLGRYPELRHPGAAERFIIGTLASVLWAAAAAGVGVLGR
ncbi:MAG TPA: hypothetical protein VK894_05465 [Jiangellales bacterium]|nr:hypothetical protein [Jiangellales bacterium]